MEQFEFHAHQRHPGTGADRDWVELEPGIAQMTLNEDAEAGRRTVLQRWRAGAANAQQHPSAHDYVEEIFVVEGDLADIGPGGGGGGGGGQRWEAGTYAYRKPGMEHGPFYSEKGCLMFVVIIPVEGGREKEEKT